VKPIILLPFVWKLSQKSPNEPADTRRVTLSTWMTSSEETKREERDDRAREDRAREDRANESQRENTLVASK
jgi:hypothetical protein